MMKRVLIVYSTTDGHTLKICQRLKQQIEQHNHSAELLSVDDTTAGLPSFDKIVLGASIRYGKHHAKVHRFIEQYKNILAAKPNAFFSVNLVARKPEKASADTNPYVSKFLKNIPWHPQIVGVFAGVLNYPRYSFSDRLLIRLIMWITKGPTDPATVAEYTDWQKVDAFGRQITLL
ncbi:menaquinone-dependent protoporphyrinogen IX dehydrogenase [Cesiribacter sp. SM1]|uniref:menaquinone-dependent protoporphyrinogen IX dehydrogenase n=1 Tax=Cesiribacter sp. SM1 TaxID=2861196 RepID=UPI001CD2D2E2|nr:menaquinone-dependent protoporphyrinogen IX dehydrogenase [Cesiribacter sp. SM1]